MNCRPKVSMDARAGMPAATPARVRVIALRGRGKYADSKSAEANRAHRAGRRSAPISLLAYQAAIIGAVLPRGWTLRRGRWR